MPKLNSLTVTQDSINAPLISVDISMKIHQFVYIKQALFKFGCYLTFEFIFKSYKPANWLM